MTIKNNHIGIVGGGILGMTLALELRDLKYDVTIIERERDLGGLAGSTAVGDFVWDKFYHVILLSDTHLLTLLERLDLRAGIRWGITKTGFFTDRQFYSLSNLFEFLRFPPLNLLDKIRLGATIYYASKIARWEKLEAITVADWLVKLSGRRTFDKIWLPLLKSKLGSNYEKANASFIWAIIARMYAARQSGLKQEMFGYSDSGYSRILDRFKSLLVENGVTIECGHEVTGIRDFDSAVRLDTRKNRVFEFGKVVLTIPCSQISQTVPQLSDEEKSRLNRVDYQGVICVAMLLKKALSGFYVTNITEDWVPFTAIIEMTALVDRDKFGGNTLIYLPLYLAQDDPTWLKSDREIVDGFQNALFSMYPGLQAEDVVAYTVARERHVLPVTTLHYSEELLPPVETSQKNIYIVNSAQIPNGTMNINEIIGHGHKMTKILAHQFRDGGCRNANQT